MKLTAFERNPFDPTAIQKPTLNTSDQSQTDIENIRADYSNPFLSSSAKRVIRNIEIPVEYINKYTDGKTFKGKFKLTEVTSGEPEIIHNTQQPPVTKPIDVNLNATVDLRKQDDEDLPSMTLNFSASEYRAMIELMPGRSPIEMYSDPDRDLNHITQRGSNPLSAKNALRSFLRTNLQSAFFSQSAYLESNYEAIENLNEIASLDGETIEIVNQIFSYNFDYAIPGSATTRSFPVYFKSRSNVTRKYSIKEPCLKDEPSGKSIVYPIRETKEIENFDPQYVKQNGDPIPQNDPSLPLNQRIPDSIREYAPLDISADDITLKFVKIANLTRELMTSNYATADFTVLGINDPLRRNPPFGRAGICFYEISLSSKFDNFIDDLRRVNNQVIDRNVAMRSLFSRDAKVYTSARLENMVGRIRPATLIQRVFSFYDFPSDKLISPWAWVDFLTSGSGLGILNLPSGGHEEPQLINGQRQFVQLRVDLSVSLGILENYVNNIRAEAQNYFSQNNVEVWRRSQTIKAQENQIFASAQVPFKSPNLSFSAQELRTAMGITQGRLLINNRDYGRLYGQTTPVPVSDPSDDKKDYLYQVNNPGTNIFRAPGIRFLSLPLVSSGQSAFPTGSFSVSQDIMRGDRQITIQTVYRLLGKQGSRLLFVKDVRTIDQTQATCENPDGSMSENVQEGLAPNDREDFHRMRIQIGGELPVDVDSNWARPGQALPDFPNARGFDIGQRLADRLAPQAPANFVPTTDKPVPTLQDWLDNGGNFGAGEGLEAELTVLDPPLSEGQERSNLLASIDKSWPWVQVSELSYEKEEERIVLGLRRGQSAPIPPKNFFDSVIINGRSFLASKASYETEDGVALWKWGSSLDFLECLESVPLVLRKSGRSRTNAINESRLVRKSTVETNQFKDLPGVVGGLVIDDIDFGTSFFRVVFKGDVLATDFSAVFVKSVSENNSEPTFELTRHLKSGDAIRQELSGGRTAFHWPAQPEFGALHKNRDYELNIIRNASEESPAFFVPRPDKAHWHWPVALEDLGGGLSVKFALNGEAERLDFVSMALLNEDQTVFMPWQGLNKWKQNRSADGQSITALFDGGALGALNAGDKKVLAFQVKDYPELVLNCIKTTDFVFDTIILLNTNLKALYLKDQTGNDLIHPSDLKALTVQNEQGLRHLMIELNNDIVSPQVSLINRDMVKYDYRKIGQVLLLKRIGTFGQFPNIKVHSSKNRQMSTDQANLSHIKALPESINYHMAFPAVLTEEDLLLAQELFSRVADYDEFIIWVSGGDIAPKHTGMKGFRFVDFVKSLVANEFDFGYIDGRFNSGVNFNMELRQVS